MNYLKSKAIAHTGTAVMGLFALGLVLAPSSAQACTKTVYVHYTSFGTETGSILFANKSGCWGLELPQYSGNANTWKICSPTDTSHAGTRWAYNEVTNPSTDAGHITTCRANNGGQNDTVYVTPNSGGYDVWSHSGITGVNHYFNECYNEGSVSNQWGNGCISNGGRPMWNLAQAQDDETVYNSVWGLCNAVSGGNWLGFYSEGLTDTHLNSFWRAMNDCTTGVYNP